MEIKRRVISRKGTGREQSREKVPIRIIGRYKIDGGKVKNSIGNGEAKELICTHGHELKCRNAGGRGGAGQRGIRRKKKWDNCNSIINKYIKKYDVIIQI